jgi:spermidine synthase
MNNRLFIYLLLTGFTSIFSQVIIFRELNVAFFGIELIYIIALGIWLIGSAIGTISGKFFSNKSSTQLTALSFILGILLVADILFIRSIRNIFGGVPGAYLQFNYQILAAAFTVIPVSFLLGIMFQSAAVIYAKNGNSLAKAYSIESAGGLTGGILSTLLLSFNVQNLNSALICGLLIFLTVLYFFYSAVKKTLRIIIAVFVIILIAIFIFSKPIDYLLTKQNHLNLKETTDTPYGRITVESAGGQVSVFENDILSFETESTDAEEFVHLSLTQHPNPEKILVLGGGVEGIVYELAKYHPINIDYVELDDKLIYTVLKYLPTGMRNVFDSKTVKIIIDDPRKYLNNCGNYDVIIIGMPEPSSGQNNRFYTKEFYALCNKRLNKNGIVALRLRSAENLWTNQMILRNASIYNALKSTFKDAAALPGTNCILTASNSYIEKNPLVLTERFIDRKINTKLISPQYIKYIYTNDRYSQIADILSNKSPGMYGDSASVLEVNSDLRPICYEYNTAIWLSKFFPNIDWFNPNTNLNSGNNYFDFFVKNKFILISLSCILLFFLTARFNISLRRILLVFTAGFSGMILEAMIILCYQTASGILFQNIGILLAAFMSGMAAGSYLIDKIKIGNDKIYRNIGRVIILILSLINFSFNIIISGNLLSGIIGAALFLFSAGFLTAGIFAFVSLYRVKDQQGVIVSLYSADLAGGSIGSLAAILLLIPFLGFPATGVLLGIISVLSMVLI